MEGSVVLQVCWKFDNCYIYCLLKLPLRCLRLLNHYQTQLLKNIHVWLETVGSKWWYYKPFPLKEGLASISDVSGNNCAKCSHYRVTFLRKSYLSDFRFLTHRLQIRWVTVNKFAHLVKILSALISIHQDILSANWKTKIIPILDIRVFMWK